MKTLLDNMGLDYQAPVFQGKAPSRPKKGSSKRGKAKSSSAGAETQVGANAPAASAGKGKGRSSPKKMKPQKVASAPLVEEKDAPPYVQPGEGTLSIDVVSDPELDIDDVPLGKKLKRKAANDVPAHSKKQRTSAEAQVPEFVEKWLQPPKHKVDIACSDRSALERGPTLGFAFQAAEVLRAPSEVQGANLWVEVASVAAQILLLAKNGALAGEALRVGEAQGSASLRVMRDDLEMAQRRQAELVQACEDANLEAAKAVSLVQ
ncbi:unnamed protein product [Linum trigynum]|uniref:Uncharacterized protein n=1 Tax=Linum trigynum TaxID=586398 RepID=A0AAV2DSZ1_9ROSI